MAARTGVLFDLDGTLLDTNYLHVLAWRRAIAAKGEHRSMAHIHSRIGMGSDKFLQDLFGADRSDIRRAHSREFRRLHAEIRPLPGAGDLLREVRRRGAMVVLATSAEAADLDPMRAALDAEEAIDLIVSSADVESTKPDPGIFTVGLERAGLDPKRAIAVGDTIWDVEAARGAGLDCVCVTSGGISRMELHNAAAAAVYDSPADLLRKLDESPLRRLLRR